ncbi:MULTISPECIES: ECF transporter S component [Leuconostoc]|uniref:Integral membrane protein n=1 Tax=Leuconostoc kimchii (strain IMSNU 11154 / KCTC 2386 / IH25) TaxID=762051 RepID=D5T156_LEUKI|nr:MULTISPECIES: ECF transporter S component [Leuconostoc]ADG40005.1 integral membrane protein [Leuconostoc kimchii IMSNU 11154]AEJ30197.1 integral membrane protein [Leuconostoc sp. C2]
MTNNRTKYLVMAIFFMAIVIIQVVVPWLGYIPLGAFIVGAAPTIIQFTVAIAAIILGARWGAFMGAFWGLITLWQAWSTPGTIGSLIFQNPITAIVPRLLMGFLIGWLFNQLLRGKSARIQVFGLASLGALAALLNTVGVVLSTAVGFTVMHTNFTGVPTENILGWLVSIVAFNGIFEVITGAILVTIIGKILVPLAENSGIKG